MASETTTRRYDIDWLRVLATYLLFLFHVGMVFNPAPFYHIRNADLSFFFLILCGFIGLWHMPLFFLLAGWSILPAVRARGAGGFLRERLLRLLVPLVAGCALLMPPIKYLELRGGLDANFRGLFVAPDLQDSFRQVIPSGLPAAPPFEESFLAFLPSFYTQLDRFTWAHLWFLLYLLLFTLLCLPVVLRLRGAGGRREQVGRWWVYAPLLPLVLIEVVMRPRWPGLHNLVQDWASVASYGTYLMAGLLLARHPALEAAAERECKRSLAIGAAAALVLLLGALGVIGPGPVLLAAAGAAGWCFVVALFGFARGHLSARGSPALRYLSESSLPIYVLHQSAIVLIGYAIIQLPIGLTAKFFSLLVASIAATLLAYHFGVRRFSVLRFLCGMKPRGEQVPGRLAVRVGWLGPRRAP